MQIRKPVVAGRFYPGGADSCITEIEQCLREYELPQTLPETIIAGIVPHAGWIFSGGLAAMVFSAIKKCCGDIDTFVICGAHSHFGSPAVYDKGSWSTPLGEAPIDEQLADEVLGTKTAVSDAEAHAYEHSIEVQVPFVQYLFPHAQILPILTPPSEKAVPLGDALGDIIKKQQKKITLIGSTDLTHYGPGYNFTPMGTGKDALRWASDVNDKEFIDLAVKLDAKGLLSSAAENMNACGPGAVAAAVSAAKTLGKTEGLLLAHTNSNEIMLQKMGSSSAEAVGYAAIVF